MKYTVLVQEFKNALVTADRATGKNLALPVLGTVLIIATEKKLKIRATNLSIGIEMVLPATVHTEGVIAIRGEVLTGYLSGLKDSEEITCELVGELFTVTAKKSRVSIKTFSHEDFPTIPAVKGIKMEIPAAALVDGISSVSYAVSVTDIKPEISSINLYNEDKTLVFVATDSFRLAEKKVKLKQSLDQFSLLIPGKNMNEVARIFSMVDDIVTLEYSENQIAFSYRNTYITSRLVNGSFPDYKQIIPKSSSTQAIVLKQDLVGSLKMANVFSGKLNQVSFDVNPKEKKMIVRSASSDIGDEHSTLDAAISGDQVSIAVNLRYFTDCFQSITSDSVSLSINGSQKPVIIRGVDIDTFFYLVMPMNA